MDIMIPHAKVKPVLLTHMNKYSKINTTFENPNNDSLIPPAQVQLPLHRPRYKPPRPIKVKPPRKKTKPVTTPSDVLYLFDNLKLPVTPDIYSLLIKECTDLADPSKAIELHDHMRKSRIGVDLPLLNRILLMCMFSGCCERAYQLFDVMSVRDFNSWAVMIGGFVENGMHYEALDLFVRMLYDVKFENVCDDHARFSVSGILVCTLKACLAVRELDVGMQVHGWLWKMGFSEDVTLSSFLISFYGKFNHYKTAQNVFNQVRSRNTAVWTSIMDNCCKDNDFTGAITAFKEMGSCEIKKNSYTFSSVLKACGGIGDIECGRQVHACAMKLGLESNSFVQCALVDLYGNSGLFNDASRIFKCDKHEAKGECFNALVANYMRHTLCNEGIWD